MPKKNSNYVPQSRIDWSSGNPQRKAERPPELPEVDLLKSPPPKKPSRKRKGEGKGSGPDDGESVGST